MGLIYFFKNCEAQNRIIIKDIKKLPLFDKITLAYFWGVKHLFFNVTQQLIKEAIEREKANIKFGNKIKELQKNTINNNR